MSRATMVAQTWKPLRQARCVICKVRFVILGYTDTTDTICSACLRRLRP